MLEISSDNLKFIDIFGKYKDINMEKIIYLEKLDFLRKENRK